MPVPIAEPDRHLVIVFQGVPLEQLPLLLSEDIGDPVPPIHQQLLEGVIEGFEDILDLGPFPVGGELPVLGAAQDKAEGIHEELVHLINHGQVGALERLAQQVVHPAVRGGEVPGAITEDHQGIPAVQGVGELEVRIEERAALLLQFCLFLQLPALRLKLLGRLGPVGLFVQVSRLVKKLLGLVAVVFGGFWLPKSLRLLLQSLRLPDQLGSPLEGVPSPPGFFRLGEPPARLLPQVDPSFFDRLSPVPVRIPADEPEAEPLQQIAGRFILFDDLSDRL